MFVYVRLYNTYNYSLTFVYIHLPYVSAGGGARRQVGDPSEGSYRENLSNGLLSVCVYVCLVCVLSLCA